MERVTPRGMRAVSRSFEIELSHSMMVRTTSRAFLCDGARTTSFPVKHKTATLVGTPMLFSALRDQISTKTCLQAPIRFRKVDGGEEKRLFGRVCGPRSSSNRALNLAPRGLRCCPQSVGRRCSCPRQLSKCCTHSLAVCTSRSTVPFH